MEQDNPKSSAQGTAQALEQALEQGLNRKQARKPLALLWPLLRPHSLKLAGGALAMVVSAAMMLAMGWGLKNIVDRGFSDGTGDFLDHALLVMTGVIFLMAAASFARLRLVYSVAERVTADLRRMIYRHLLTLDPSFHEQHKTGDQVSRINADTAVLQIVVTSNLPSAFRHAMMLLGGLVMLCFVSPSMTGVVMLSVPLIVGPMIYFGRRVRSKSRDSQSRIGDIGAYTQETLSGVQTIQSFGYESAAAGFFDRLADDSYNTAMRYINARAFLMAFVIFMVLGAIGFVLWLGGHKVVAGEMTAGDLSAFIFYAATVAGAVMAISEATTDFNRAGGAADRIMQVLNTPPSLAHDSVLPDDTAGSVSFDNVTFSYPTRPQQRALDQVSFDVGAGQMAALVGASGAGKTTVFQLLQRFYDPQSGSIRIGGHDIGSIDPVSLRRHMGIVSQDPAIFSMSVGENIRMAKTGATDDEVRRAAEMAQAHEFITALPQGYDTVVGERGSRLSGGQRQRIAIARAILKDPKILLLDEATSALDGANEQAVHLALKSVMKGRTTIVIAHRLSTVEDADRVIVLDGGRVVAAGSHADAAPHLSALQRNLKAG
jgi:ATP-binding cassette subfamily B protein